MASIANDPGGRRRILFVATDGSRKTIRLGKVSQRGAESIKARVEQLLEASALQQAMPQDLARWVAELPADLARKLAAVGLIANPETKPAVTLGPFIDAYIAQRADVKPTTAVVLRQARRWLTRFLGEDKPLDSITSTDGDAFRAYLISEQKQSRSTVNKWVRYGRHFLEVAKRRKLLAENPFSHLKGAVTGDPNRRVFIPAADVARVIEHCPDPQWKLLIALARFGGLRIPSEALALTWRDVDIEKGRFIVRATKTEHHKDGGIRVVPIFPELLPHFRAVFDAVPEGSTHVITRYRNTAANLRTQLVRYITAAGLTPWQKPWQNMRASRATELADTYPSHVCAAWLGHTEAVADAFYRQVTESHFERARMGGELVGDKAAQKAAQQAHAGGCKDAQAAQPAHEKTPVLQGFAAPCDMVHKCSLGGRGLEPLTSTV